MAKAKSTASKGRTKKNEARASEAGAKGARAPKGPESKPQASDDDVVIALEQLPARVGAADPELEQALRSAHPDAELRKEGARVASERIVLDGALLCSRAALLLESKDADVANAVKLAGLSRGWVALTVDAVLRVKGTAADAHARSSKSSDKKLVASAALTASAAKARSGRRLALRRMRQLAKADADIAAKVERWGTMPTDPGKLADQLDEMGALVEALPAHPSKGVRVLATHKGFEPAQGKALVSLAAELRQAYADSQQRTATTGAEQRQAVLDVLDGLALLLLSELYNDLNEVAELCPKVRRPMLHRLRNFFARRKAADGEADEGEGGEEGGAAPR